MPSLIGAATLQTKDETFNIFKPTAENFQIDFSEDSKFVLITTDSGKILAWPFDLCSQTSALNDDFFLLPRVYLG